MRLPGYFIFLLFLSGCFGQSPAPIEYHGNEKASNSAYFKYNNNSITALPQEDTIHSLKFKNDTQLKTIIFEDGDSLKHLAKDFGVSEKALLLSNRLSSEKELKPGRKLIIPNVITHNVQEGETIEVIAEDYNQDINIIAELNDLKAPYKLISGDTLDIIIEPELKLKDVKVVARNIEPGESYANKSKIVTLFPKTSTKFIMPVQGIVKTKFRQGEGVKNEGIIIASNFRAPIKAIADGEVIFSGNKPNNFGNYIIIKHVNNTLSAYAHLNDMIVTKGKLVKKGEVIGHVGKTGNAKDNELYFALRIDDKAVDPLLYIK